MERCFIQTNQHNITSIDNLYIFRQGNCKVSGAPKEVAAIVSSYSFVTPSKNSQAMMAALIEHGPLATIMQIVHSLYQYS